MNMKRWLGLGLSCLLCWSYGGGAGAEPGITNDSIRIGSVLALDGQAKGLGKGMKAGLEAAFRGVKIKGKSIELIAVNDSYEPKKAVEATQALLKQNIFLMAGNVGTPTAQATLPILAENKVPAVGFFTGAVLLRPGKGDIVNFRASYVQETASVINAALAAGLKPENICAYVQNDAYGMAGIIGIQKALAGKPGTEKMLASLDEILKMEGDNPPRNQIGPVGVYVRNTLHSLPGYESLKLWESTQGVQCKLVVSVGAYAAIARFVAYSRYKGDSWLVSAVSFTGADNFRKELTDLGIDSRIIMTQVVPELTSELPVVKMARQELKDDFGFVSLEGYLVGKMLVAALQSISGEITREAFMAAIKGKSLKVEQLTLDFTQDNQGSDLVLLTYLNDTGYRTMQASDWQ